MNVARHSDNTLVFCALGYSRSAVMVIASLVEQGQANSIDEAIDRVRKARPRLVLSALHKARLKDWYDRR
jgi:protein-tyrosine phosphatase